MASSCWFANVSNEEIVELITLVQFLSQCNMQLSMVFKCLKVFKTASLNLLVYFETVQKATVSTAGAEIVNRYSIKIEGLWAKTL